MQPGGFGKIDVEAVHIPGVFYSPVLVQKRIFQRDRSFAEMVIGAGVAGDTVGDMQPRRRFEETDGDVAEPDSAEPLRGNDEEREFLRIEILRRLAPVGAGTAGLLEGRGGNEISGIFGILSVTAGGAPPWGPDEFWGWFERSIVVPAGEQ